MKRVSILKSAVLFSCWNRLVIGFMTAMFLPLGAQASSLTVTTANVGANQVTIVPNSSATATGYFTLLPNSATCGSVSQTVAGQDSTGTMAAHFGSLALTGGTNGSYTVRNLTAGTTYKVCFAVSSPSGTATATFTTTAAAGLSPATWANVGSNVFNTTTPGGFPYIAFTPDGTPNVGFMDFTGTTDNKMSVATYSSSAWAFLGSQRFSTVVGNESNFAIAPDGTPYVVYNDTSSSPIGVTVMKYTGGAWSVVGIRNFVAASQGYSLAFGLDGTPYVSAIEDSDGGAVVYKYTGSSWTSLGGTNVTGSVVYGLALTIGSDGTPYLAYGDGSNSARSTVVAFNGSSWNLIGSGAVSPNGAGSPVLAGSPAGLLYVAFVDGATNKVSVEQYNGSSWSVVGSSSMTAKGGQVALAFAPDGNPILAYADANANFKISVLKYSGSSWSLLGAANFSQAQSASLSVAESPNGTPYVAYLDSSNYVHVMSLQAPQPIVTTGSASAVKPTTATLNGTVNDNSVATSVSFDYGTTTSYGTNVAATTPSGGTIASGTGATAVSVNLTGLSASTTYHFRVNGTGGGNTVNGLDATFTTPAIDHLGFTVVPSTATAGTSFNVTVTAYSDSGSTAATSYTGPVTFTSTDSQAVFPSGTLNLTSGVGTFAITLKMSGSQTLTVKDANSSLSATSGNITVGAGVVSSILASMGSGQSAVVTSAFANPLVVQALDAYSNPVGGVVVTFTVPSSGAGAVLNGSTCTTSLAATPSGSCSVTATANSTTGGYSITAGASGASSGMFSLTNNPKMAQTITFTQPGTQTFGTAPTLTATASSTLAVTFSSTTTGVCTITSGGTLTFVATGTCTINADQAGNSSYDAATTVPRSLTVQAASQTITFTPPTSPVTFGTTTAVSLSATATSGLTPTFSRISGPGSVSGNTLTINGVGSIVIAADQAGNTNYSAAPQVLNTVVVNPASQTITFTQPTSPVVYGSATTLALTATGGASGNAVTFSVAGGPGTISGSTLTVTGAGTILVNADQAGNSNYTAATTVQKSVVVSKASTTLTGPASQPVFVVSNQTGAIPVSIAGQYSGAGIAAPGGSISYAVTNSSNTTVGSGSLVISSGGVTVPVPNTLAPGLYTVTASYTADTNYNGATPITVNLQVGQIQPTITWGTPPALTYGAALTSVLNAQAVNGSNTVAGTYAYLNGAAPVTSSTVLPAGSYTLTVNFTPTDATTYKTATNTVSLTVNKATPGVSLSPSATSLLVQNSVTLTATVGSAVSTPTGTVTFLDGASPLGTVTLTNGIAAFSTSSLAVGSHSITAVYSGDTNFVTMTSTPATNVQVNDFSLTISATSSSGSTTSQTVLPGGQAVYNFTISPTGATTFPAAVNLTVSGLPSGATYTISPQTIAAGAGATNVALTINVPKQTAMLHTGEKLAPLALALLVLPFGGSLRRRAGKLSKLVAMFLLLTGGAAGVVTLTGCGSTTGFFASPQTTYNVTITGTSGVLTHSTTVTLTVQ